VRILQVIHQFPPFSSQGSEVYCYNLAKQLQDTDDVRVFHISSTTPRRPRRLVRGTYETLPTYHCVDDREYARLADWPNQFLRATFDEVIAEFSPDIVHFHNFLSLADDLPTRAGRNAPVVYTLHDFGLICPNSLLLRTDDTPCSKNHPDFFQDCCPVLIRVPGRISTSVVGSLPSLARWELYANQESRVAPRAALKLAVGTMRWLGNPRTIDVARKREFFLTHTRRIFDDVRLFLAPSEFLRERYVACGVPAEKIKFARYGLRRFEARRTTSSGNRIAFGYIGALHRHKGLELLLEAFQGLSDRADLHVYGSPFGSPISARYWERLKRRFGRHAIFHGAYENQQLSAILGSLDAIVVPSIWYENSPLTIQESFIGGVPVITADRGGMAELVRNGVDGLHFRLGDADSLRATLRSIIDSPGMLAALRQNIPVVPDIMRQAAAVRTDYAALLA
jgi:glycosyltransferase involved in cell wall biosynthesis